VVGILAGFPTGCWHALLVQQVVWREFRVTYNVQYLAALLKNLGFSFQKARFVSDHLDAVARAAWRPGWRTPGRHGASGPRRPRGCCSSATRPASRSGGRLATPGCAGAPIGQQPVVKTTGRRRAYKVCGLIEFFSGRLFHRGVEGKFNAASYRAFLEWGLAQTTHAHRVFGALL